MIETTKWAQQDSEPLASSESERRRFPMDCWVQPSRAAGWFGPSRTRNRSHRARARGGASRWTAGYNHRAQRDGLGPAGLEPATSWFVAECGLFISLVLRAFSSDENLSFPRVRQQIVH